MTRDAASFEKARALAQRIGTEASALSGVPFLACDRPVTVAGDVGHVQLGIVREQTYRTLGVVCDLGETCNVVMLGERQGRPELVGSKPDAKRVASALAEAVKSRALERVGLSAFDATFGLLDVLAQTLAVPNSRWRSNFWGEWDERPTETGGSVGLGGAQAWDDLVRITQKPRGVEVQIWGDTMGALPIQIGLETLEAFAARVMEVVVAMRQAIDGRARFRARTFSIARAGEHIAHALRKAKAAEGSLRFDAREGSGFPREWPSGIVWRVDRIGEHVCVALGEDEKGVHARAGSWSGRFDADAAIEAALPRIIDEVRKDRGRLTYDKLEPRASYEIIEGITHHGRVLSAGTRLRFERAEYIWRESLTYHCFHVEGDDKELVLCDLNDIDVALLRRLHEWLQRRF